MKRIGCLDLDTEREVAFSMMPLGWGAAPTPAAPARIAPLNLQVDTYSPKEIDYPAMRLIWMPHRSLIWKKCEPGATALRFNNLLSRPESCYRSRNHWPALK